MTKIKICGIKEEKEALFLNEKEVDYAGFVWYKKSRRYVTEEKTKQIFRILNPNIKKVAVVVSPDQEILEKIENTGFDILQIHGPTAVGVLEQIRLPLWRAVSVSEIQDLKQLHCGRKKGQTVPEAVLLDAAVSGSGRTFGWDRITDIQEKRKQKQEFADFRQQLTAQGIRFILAGGLDSKNVAEGIRFFSPDVVDVSSGVEDTDDGVFCKSRAKIEAFVRAVRESEYL